MPGGRPPVTAIIPDGNRRWARLHGAPITVAYLRAVEQLREALALLFWRAGSPVVYVYASSLENCVYRRGPDARALAEAASGPGIRMLEWLEREGVNVYFYGCINVAPRPVASFAEPRLLEAPPKPPALVVLTCYSYLAEARRGRALGLNPPAPPADLVYRSGGERRLSGFPPLLVTYAELYFDEEYWPEAGARGVARALEWYHSRVRRLGR